MWVSRSFSYALSAISVNRLAVFSLLLMACCVTAVADSAKTVSIKFGQTSYQIELAVTPEQRRKGLMFREKLNPDQGMLLVYPQTANHNIWMKNMRIPLRVFWIDETFTVLGMQRLEPCTESPCPVYSNPEPSRYVLELSDHDHPIKAGDKVEGLDVL